MSSETSGLPDTPDGLAAWVDGLTFHRDEPVAPDQTPPQLGDDEDALVPRGFKIPQRLDATLQEIATRLKISKSELVRRYLEAGVAADLASSQDKEVLIPLADALRALAGLSRPHRAA